MDPSRPSKPPNKHPAPKSPKSKHTRFVLQLVPQPYPTKVITCIYCIAHRGDCPYCLDTGIRTVAIDPKTNLPIDQGHRYRIKDLPFTLQLPPQHHRSRCNSK